MPISYEFSGIVMATFDISCGWGCAQDNKTITNSPEVQADREGLRVPEWKKDMFHEPLNWAHFGTFYQYLVDFVKLSIKNARQRAIYGFKAHMWNK